MPENKKENPHEGHRQRVKNRFLKHGLESFEDHQVLEALLFYSVPKKDTNELAHLLLKTYGSIDKVFEADYDDLIKIKGVGENTASLIKFFQMLSKRYVYSTFVHDGAIRLNEPKILMNYCRTLFKGEKKEIIYAIALDDELYLIDKMKINSGEPNRVEVPFRNLTEFAIKCNCTRMVIAHNHPNGPMIPSRADIHSTSSVADQLSSVDVELVDHIVVGRNGATSIRERNPDDVNAWRDQNGFF